MKSKKKVLSKVNKSFLNNLENMCKRKTGVVIKPIQKKNIKKIVIKNKKIIPKIQSQKITSEIQSQKIIPEIQSQKIIPINNSHQYNNLLIIKYFFYYIITINIILIANPILFYMLFRYL